MNALTTTPNSKLAKPTSPVLSPELTELLDASGSPDAAARRIVSSPELTAEARAALPALQAVATAKAGQAGVKAVIGRRLVTYPQPARSDGEWEAWWADYFDVLSDVSLAALEAGMRAYVADPNSEFMPKPGRLRELAFTAPCRSYLRYMRASRAVQMADEPPTLPPAQPSPEDAAEIKRMAAEAMQKLGAATALKRPELPSIAGKADEGGLTPQMRELIARRQAEGRA